VKRVELIRHLVSQGCLLLREGSRHSVYVNAASGALSTIPRHREINDFLARRICKDLDIEPPAR
jgi:hypothetical protein